MKIKNLERSNKKPQPANLKKLGAIETEQGHVVTGREKDNTTTECLVKQFTSNKDIQDKQFTQTVNKDINYKKYQNTSYLHLRSY
ncbi:hypothetical protein PR048_024619 [Dryococelus australis]|uniref:Uncharacterized protein n=1 Tax=Dryococelus australis TaxID=614101 RepID=A0ABQ9GP33_9NEOP|nr:hypothetical protein PR048_024619 [Dryococelus australis]